MDVLEMLLIARKLHEGGDVVDVKIHLAQFRERTQGRVGRRWVDATAGSPRRSSAGTAKRRASGPTGFDGRRLQR
jgi:hypothetical protein